MIMSVTSSKTMDELDRDLRKAIQRHKFGVLNVLDLKQTLGNKGIPLERECRVYDICNPQAASTALNTDMSVSVVLPCRVSVYQDGQTLTIATVKPTDLFMGHGPKQYPLRRRWLRAGAAGQWERPPSSGLA